MQPAPSAYVRVLVVLVAIILPLRLSLGTSLSLGFSLQQEHAIAAARTQEESAPAHPEHRKTPVSHACCFHFALATVLPEMNLAAAERPAWNVPRVTVPASFHPDIPRKPPRRATTL